MCLLECLQRAVKEQVEEKRRLKQQEKERRLKDETEKERTLMMEREILKKQYEEELRQREEKEVGFYESFTRH